MNKSVNKVFLIHFGIVFAYAAITRLFSGIMMIPWFGDIYFTIAAILHILSVVIYIGLGKESEIPIWLHVLMIMMSVVFWVAAFMMIAMTYYSL